MKIPTICIVAALYAATVAAQAPPRRDSLVLTRAAAVAAALASNPQLDVAREQTAEARARQVQAVSIPDPTFTYSYDNQTRFLGLGTAANRNAVVTLLVPFPNRFALRNRIGAADVHSAEYSYTGLRQQLASQTSSSYDTLLAAYRHREIFLTSRGLAQDFLKKTQARFEGGTAAKLDVVRAQVAVAQAENQLIGAERDIQTASNALDRFIGRPVGTPVATRDSLSIPPTLPELEMLEQAALTGRSELGGLASQQEGAKAATSLAKQFWVPDFTLSAQKDFAADSGSALFAAGITMPFPIFFWQHAMLYQPVQSEHANDIGFRFLETAESRADGFTNIFLAGWRPREGRAETVADFVHDCREQITIRGGFRRLVFDSHLLLDDVAAVKAEHQCGNDHDCPQRVP